MLKMKGVKRSKTYRYRGGGPFSEKRDFEIQTEISITFFCLEGGGHRFFLVNIGFFHEHL